VTGIERAPDLVPDWPVTVTARWTDPGYSPREQRWGIAFAAALGWMGGIGVVAGRPSKTLIALAVVVAAALAWRHLRARPTAIELRVEPKRLVVRPTADVPSVELRRDRAGVLSAAERGLDWRERLLGVTDRDGTIGIVLPAGIATVSIQGDAVASAAWWAATMPVGTTPVDPPATLSVTALLGAWWPDPGQRTSVRGSFGGRGRWKEPDLRDPTASDRRQRRLNSAIVLAAVLFAYGLATFSVRSWTFAEAVAYLPPGLVVVALCVRNLR
jgi:hypothetical protein